MGLMHPALLFVVGAALAAVLRGRPRQVVLVAVPLVAFLSVNAMVPGTYGTLEYLGFRLVPAHVDKLALVFLNVFTLMALIGAIYGLHVEDTGQHVSAMLYVAGSLGVTLAGDYLTLFVWWELMAFASAFLVFLRRRQASVRAGFRYLLVHTVGGLVLMAGIFLKWMKTGDLSFGPIPADTADLAAYLILIGFALNAAVPPIHAWLPDAYPEATVMGAVFMCAFTTKTAVYVLARAFSGYEVLAVAGAIMTIYGVLYAIIENDGRRILAYHIVSQVGYMVCGIGIGTALAVNGAVAHAYAHILYKALLFMGVGAVLEMAGTSKLSELGGLYRRMPLAMVATVIGGISISGFPLTSGFISKSMVIAGAGADHRTVLMLMLSLAAVGTFLSVGVKLPYFIWFGKDSGRECKDPPKNMLVAMGIAAFFCFFLGVYPDYLYRMLPFPVEYHPYNAYHLSETLQLLGFTGLAFYLLRKKLTPEAKLNLDLDWFYRRATAWFLRIDRRWFEPANEWVSEIYRRVGYRFALGAAALWSRFDVKAIDGVVDGSAYGVLGLGDRVRRAQTGRLQQYIAMAVAALFFLIALVVNL
ncbi:MAG: Na(+)/H(+) antiporter subunit D [Deltaproteobacteria bacterium]|nr:Na(+)/H(+) antiporter subunit D [Deltaproteobacteria bacterium]